MSFLGRETFEASMIVNWYDVAVIGAGSFFKRSSFSICFFLTPAKRRIAFRAIYYNHCVSYDKDTV